MATTLEESVREFANPALVTVDPSDTLGALVRRNAAERPDHVCFDRPDGERGWTPVTSSEFLAEVESLARGLHAQGISPGDRVGLMSRTRYEWTLIDFALWTAGAVVVPIYETSSSEQVLWILADSGATACFVETPLHQKTLDSVLPGLPGLTHVWNIGDGAVDELLATGAALPASTLDDVAGQVNASSLATIIYTSGTTGRPKGCKLTHSNFLFDTYNIIDGMQDVFCVPGSSTLLFLPLAHVFARIIEVACVHAGVRIAHTPSTARLLKDLESVQPTFLLAVPRVFERVFNASRQKAEEAGKAKLRIFDAAAATAVAYSQALDAGGPGRALRARHALFDKLVYGKLRAALGGRVRYAVSGGAALGEHLGHFFRGIGVVVLEGYGLTETTAGSCINRPDVLRIGTVGQPVPGCAARVEEDGEILLRGGHIFAGYWNDDAATAAALDADGWFRTGDVGMLDADGFLRITGRKKELIVTAGGKNVAPSVLEDRLRAHPLISQCVVVGDARAYIGVLVTIDPEAFDTWKTGRGKPEDADVASLVDDVELRRAVLDAIDEANHAVSRAEAIRRFAILPFDFTEDNGYLTPSLKVRRTAVLTDLAEHVDRLYT